VNNTLQNGFRLLDHLGQKGEALSVKELAEHFQLPNSHICRLLKSLTETGYVEQLPRSRKYRISLKVLSLAHARLQKERLLEVSRPYLKELAVKLDSAVFITRRYGAFSLIIGTEYPPLCPGSRETVIGALHSPTNTACGQICAAYSSEEEQKGLFEEIDWSAPGDFQNSPRKFQEELACVRRRGYALRNFPGMTGAVGVPLFEESCRFIGALGVMLSPHRPRNSELLQQVIEATLVCGKLVSFAQGAPAEGYPHYINPERKVK
jgi:DNA-binding IclR family transcriptional regulator